MNKIYILLSTYNGEEYLKEQLDSLFMQTYDNWILWIHDDNSVDGTVEIIREYEKKYPEKVRYIDDGISNGGAKENFCYILSKIDNNYDYLMFCDQDDVWESFKIEETLSKMKEMERKYGNIPLLVHTDLELVDKNLNTISMSFVKFHRIIPVKNKLNNLLIRNIITGCTVMVNKILAQKSLVIPKEVIMHDWWMGLIASCFGRIGYVNKTTIKYRQHSRNTVGYKKVNHVEDIKKGFNLFYKIRFDKEILQAKAFFTRFENELNKETSKMLKDFISLYNKNWLQRRTILWKYKILRHYFMRNVGLFLKI